MTVPKARRVLRLPETMHKTGLGRDTIYRGGREGWFPKPIAPHVAGHYGLIAFCAIM